MYNVIFNSGFIGLLIWLLLFTISTAGLAIAIRCAWMLRRRLFISTEHVGKTLPLLQNGDWQGAYEQSMAGTSLIDDITRAVLLAAHDIDS